MTITVKPITEDRIPGAPKEQLFLAMAEGGTVLTVGKIPDGPGHLAPVVCIYRLRDDAKGYEGWIYVKEHLNKKLVGLSYHEMITSEVVQLFPGIVDYVAFVEPHFAERTGEREVKDLIFLVVALSPQNKKAN